MTPSPVLIVDDSLTVRMDLAETFRDAGFEVRACGTIADARATLERETIGLVILDVLLPDGDGIDLLRELRAMPDIGDLPVLLLSTESEVRDRIRGMSTGADEYVGKPYDASYLVARARELMRRRSPEESTGPGQPKVLIIDDSETLRNELTRLLRDRGYEVFVAGSGEEGLRIAATIRPDALIVDSVLPGLDGSSVIRRLRLDPALRRTTCLLLTGSDEGDDELKALEAGADAFARKGDDPMVLVARLAAILRSSPTESRGQQPSLMGPKKILAVDDSLTYLEALAAALRGEEYDIILAHSGEEALDLLSVQPVDCILLDLMMPGIGGEETCRRLKSAPAMRDIPLVMLTAVESPDAMIAGLAAGADDYIAKSSDFQVLEARVRAQIRRKLFEEENRRIRSQLFTAEVEAAEARAAQETAELRAAVADELERKNRELESFSYSVSHDLRAPLRSIDGFSQALEEDYGQLLDDQGRDYLARVRASAKRMGELIDDLLALAQVGKTELRHETVDLSGLAHRVAGLLARSDPSRRVRVEIADGLEARCDSQMLRIVLENLIGNARKFTSATADATIEIGKREESGQIVFFVRDNGVGFDMAHSHRLFAPFQRLHAQEEFPGTGVGLATVQRIVERHGGRVWIEGAVSQGAAVYWTLPSPKGGRNG